MQIPADCKYTRDHEWIRIESGNIAYVGITDYAQSELGELVYVEVDTLDEDVAADAPFGAVEAVKTTSDLFMPIDAKVIEFNAAIDEAKGGDPAIINSDPYGEGWIVKVEINNLSDLDELMDAEAYKAEIA